MNYQALLFSTDEKASRVVSQILSELEFQVEACSEPFFAVKQITNQHYDALVVDCDNEQNATLLFKSARNSSSNGDSLAVALVQGQGGIAKAFRIGANLVLTKPIHPEQSKGTLRTAKGLLRKAEAAKSASAAKSTSAAVAVQKSESSPVSSLPISTQPAPTVLPASAGLSVDSTASGALEREEEKFPELAPTEAALVESMPNLLPLQSAASASTSSQETARETSTGISAAPVAIQSLAGGAASAAAPAKTTLLLAAETQSPETKSLKTKNLETKNLETKSPETKSAEARSEESAPKVREVPAAVQKTEARDSKSTRREAFAQSSTAIAAENEVQTFGQIVADDSNQSPETGSKKNFLIALVLVLGSAGAVYYAWPQVSPLLMSVPMIQKYLGPQQAPNSTLPPASVAQPPAGTSTQAQPDAASVAGQTPDSTASAAASSPSSPVPSSSATGAHQAASATTNSSDRAGAGDANSSSDSASTAQSPLHVAPEIAAALLLEKPDPIYPPSALQQHLEGSVKLQANIGKDGSTSNIKTLSGNPLFAASAITAVKQWKYKPYALGGAPTEVQTQITVDFKLPHP
jgi:protein TonB